MDNLIEIFFHIQITLICSTYDLYVQKRRHATHEMKIQKLEKVEPKFQKVPLDCQQVQCPKEELFPHSNLKLKSSISLYTFIYQDDVRQGDSLRETRPPTARVLEPAGRDRHHHRLQLPRRRLRMEQRPRHGEEGR